MYCCRCNNCCNCSNLLNQVQYLNNYLYNHINNYHHSIAYYSAAINKSETYFNIGDLIELNESKNKGFVFVNKEIVVNIPGLYKMSLVLYADKASNFPMNMRININNKDVCTGTTSVESPLVIETMQDLHVGDKIKLLTGSTNVVLSGITHALIFNLVKIDNLE